MRKTLSHKDVQDRIQKMTWSFSRLRAYDQCPEMFYRSYILHESRQENAFNQYGTFCHSIYERFFKGDLFSFECGSVFRREWALYVTEEFPSFSKKDMEADWFEAAEKSFDSLEDLPEFLHVIGVEYPVSVNLSLGSRTLPFRGIVDLILLDTRDGSVHIVDHKSHARFRSVREKNAYARQLYLYAYALRENGVISQNALRSLSFHLFRAGCVETFDPSQEKEEEAISWAFDVYDRAVSDESFLQCTVLGKMTAVPLFCREICSFRSSCDPVIFSKGSDLPRKLNASSLKKPISPSRKIFRSASPTCWGYKNTILAR